jgi:putative ABC transport system permease protein
MNRLVRRLLNWTLGEVDARILLSELQESHQRLEATRGTAAANSWRRKEIIRAVLLASYNRLRLRPKSAGSSRQRMFRRPVLLREAMGDLSRDIRFGVRTLRRKPLFTLVAVGTLGLGIGASTAIFSVVEAVLLRPLPYSDPGELVQVWETFPDWRDNPQLASGWDQVYLAWPDYERWRAGQTAFQDVALYGSTVMTLTGQGAPERVAVGVASSSLLPVLGVNPILGRSFLPGEDGHDAERVALLSYAAWRDRFGEDRDLLGRSIVLNDAPFTVVGILPPGLRIRGLGIFGSSGDYPVWIPVGANNARLAVNSHSYEAIARLNQGESLARAQANTELLLRGDRSPEEIGARLAFRDELEDAGLRRPLWLLLMSATVLLLIACGNVAVLLVGEFSGRRHEIATRMAVGAGRWRVIRQLLTESLMLGMAGSVVGAALALAATRLLIGLAPPIPRLELVAVNGSVLLFGACAGIVSGLVFGLAPSLSVWSGRIQHTLQLSRGIGSTRGSMLSHGVLGVQIGLTTLLLVCAGLLARSFTGLLALDPGFEPASLAQVSVRLPTGGYADPQSRLAVFNEMAAHLAAIPGVTAVSGTSSLPFLGFPNLLSFGIEGKPEPEGGSRHASTKWVLPGFTETTGIPLLAGRTLTGEDRAELAAVVVVSETMARRFWPGESPLGARVLFGDTLTVVGIVGDVRHESMDAQYVPTMYVPLALGPRAGLTFVVRTELDPGSILPQLRQAVRSVEADAPVTRVSTLKSLISFSARNERFRTVLMIAFGCCATLLAIAGVFGVTARNVALRMREMGIRLAMGAQSGELIRLSLGRSLFAGCIGIAVGLVGALWVSRRFARFLFGVVSWDPTTYALAAVTLLALSLLASYVPARRAARVDPVEVLRGE